MSLYTLAGKIVMSGGAMGTDGFGGGVLIHGVQFTLNGSGFGTRLNYNPNSYTWKGQQYMHYCWCDFTEVTQPVTPNTFAEWSTVMNGLYPTMYDATSTFRPPASLAADGAGIASGGPSFGGLYWQRGPNPSGANDRFGGLTLRFRGVAGASYPGEYFCCKWQMTGTESNNGNIKSFRRSYYNNGVTSWEIIPVPCTPGATNNSIGGGTQEWGPPLHAQTVSGLFIQNFAPDLTAAFHRIEQVTDTTAVWYCRLNQTLLTWANSSFTVGATYPNPISSIPMWSPVTDWTAWTDPGPYGVGNNSGACLVVFCAESAIAAAYNQNVADIYFDFTPARVECTDGTFAEPQILLSWTNTQIKFLGNKGQMSSGPGTLNVYDATDTIIKSFAVTIN